MEYEWARPPRTPSKLDGAADRRTGSVGAHATANKGVGLDSRHCLPWHGIETAHIAPGKPMQNGTNESFNGKFRDECLGMEWFRSRAEAKVIIEAWRRHHNNVQPHSSLGNLTPTEFARQNRQPKLTPPAELRFQ